MVECRMPELHLSLMLAMSRMGFIVMTFLVTSVFLYLAIQGLRTGKVRGRGATYTQEENFVMFAITISAYFSLAFMTFVGLLVAVFAA